MACARAIYVGRRVLQIEFRAAEDAFAFCFLVRQKYKQNLFNAADSCLYLMVTLSTLSMESIVVSSFQRLSTLDSLYLC